MNAESAFLDNAVVAQWYQWVYIFSRHLRLGPVESSRIVRTRHHAITAAYALVIIDHNDAILVLIGGFGRANLGTRRGLAVVALQRHILLVFAKLGIHEPVLQAIAMLIEDGAAPAQCNRVNFHPHDIGWGNCVRNIIFSFAGV